MIDPATPKILGETLYFNGHKWTICHDGTILNLDAEDLVEAIPGWQEKPDEVTQNDGCQVTTDAYQIWRKGGHLWMFNRPCNLWIRIPEPSLSPGANNDV